MSALGFVIVGIVCAILIIQFISRQLAESPQARSERRIRALKPLNHVPLDEGFWNSVDRDLREARAKDRARRARR
jgi:hypothetical protein